MISTVSIRFSLRGIIISLFAVAALSTQQCGNGAVCKRNSDQCPKVTFLEHPENVTVSVGDSNVIIRCRLSNNAIAVRWIHNLRDVELDTFGGNTIRTPTDLDRFTQQTNITFSGGFFANLIILTVSPRHHGKYRCGLLSCDEFSYSGSVTVEGAVEMQFRPNENSFQFEAGQDKTVEFIVYGAPEPSLNLFKREGDGIYREITGNKFTLNLTALSVKSIQLEDAGSYRIWGNNTFGNTSLDFQINVTGVSQPIITLSETIITPSSYQTQINVTCSIPQTAYEPELELYWSFPNNTRISTSHSIKDLTNPSNISTYLIITSFSEIHNGNYTCHAMNSNEKRSSDVMLIGPPAKMDPPNVREILNEPNTVRIEWTKPNSYGAALTKYIIKYSIRTRDNTEKNISLAYDKLQTDITEICIADRWSFSIAATNEYGSTGEFSDYSLFKIKTNCPTTAVLPPPSGTTTTTPDKSRTSSTILHSSTQTSPVTSITTTKSTAQNSLPIVAGAAAGVVVLIVAVCFLVFAVLCWVTITKRASKRRAMTQWHHPEDQMDNSLSIPSLPEKSPEPHLDIMGIPSPLPATAGYGPIYIDPCYEFPRENLELTDILYDGSYTVIYKAKAVGIKENKAIEVAVKSIKEDFLEMDDYVSTLVMEMEQLSQLEPHPNIVGLLRVCTVGRPVYMVIEYMCHGDLLGFLRATRGHSDMYTVFPGTKNIPTNVKLTSRDLLNIISQVAKGMLFLSEQKIPHGALCARNVLVGTSMEVKVFNIGIHNLDNDDSFESLIRWMAPEVFMDGLRTTYSDIWSFGILMWEVVTVGGTPYKGFDLNDLHTHLMSGLRLKRPDHCTQPLYDVMQSCWENIPQHRPLFSEIIEQINNLNHLKMSFLDLKNYNEMQYSQFDISETQLTSVL